MSCYDNTPNKVGNQPKYVINIQVSGLVSKYPNIYIFDELNLNNEISATNGLNTFPIVYFPGQRYSVIINSAVYKCDIDNGSGEFNNSDINIKISCYPSSKVFLAVGANGQVLNSNDGINWVTNATFFKSDLNDVLPNILGRSYIVGNSGSLYFLVNYLYPTLINSAVTTNINGIAVSDDYKLIVLVGDNGLIEADYNSVFSIQSYNPGSSVTNFNQVTYCNGSFYGTGTINNSGQNVAVIINSTSISYNPFSMIWSPIFNLPDEVFNSIECFNNTVFVGGNNGVVLKSSQGNWVQLNLSSPVNIRQILNVANNRLIAVGNLNGNGVIYESVDGDNFTPVAVTSQLPPISSIAVNSDNTYVILTTGGIYYSNDLLTWNLVPNSPTNLNKVRVSRPIPLTK